MDNHKKLKTDSTETDKAKETKLAKTLEVPYAYGKLNVSEMIDPVTNQANGCYNIVDEEKGWSFGVFKFNADGTIENPEAIGQITLENFNKIDISESVESTPKLNNEKGSTSLDTINSNQDVIVSGKLFNSCLSI